MLISIPVVRRRRIRVRHRYVERLAPGPSQIRNIALLRCPVRTQGETTCSAAAGTFKFCCHCNYCFSSQCSLAAHPSRRQIHSRPQAAPVWPGRNQPGLLSSLTERQPIEPRKLNAHSGISHTTTTQFSAHGVRAMRPSNRQSKARRRDWTASKSSTTHISRWRSGESPHWRLWSACKRIPWSARFTTTSCCGRSREQRLQDCSDRREQCRHHHGSCSRQQRLQVGAFRPCLCARCGVCGCCIRRLLRLGHLECTGRRRRAVHGLVCRRQGHVFLAKRKLSDGVGAGKLRQCAELSIPTVRHFTGDASYFRRGRGAAGPLSRGILGPDGTAAAGLRCPVSGTPIQPTA